MRKINFKQDILPHLVAVAIFLGLTIIFFQPAFFDDKAIIQGDIDQWAASAQELADYRETNGEEGLWTNSIFGGMPAYFISVKWDKQPIMAVNWLFSMGLPKPMAFCFTGMICFYIMLLCFKVRPYVAIIGAVCFAFSSYNIIGVTAGHNARLLTIIYMPLVIGGIHLCYRRNLWLGFGLTAMALALQLRPNHLQITYYLALVVGIYILVEAAFVLWKYFKEGKEKALVATFLTRSAMLALAALLAVGTFFGKFYTASEFSRYSNRGPSELSAKDGVTVDKEGLSKTYAFQYSNGISDPITLFIPNFLGGSQPFDMDSELVDVLQGQRADARTIQQYRLGIPTYWGKESPTTYYAGAVMVFLFVLGIFIVERKYVIWLVAVAFLGILLSYGRNLEGFNYFMFDHFPGYSKFRSVTFTIIMPIMAIILLGCLALEKALSAKTLNAFKKPLLISLGVTGGLALLFALVAGIFRYQSAIDSQLPDIIVDAVQNDRKALLRADAFRSFLFIGLFGAVLYISSLNKLSTWIVRVALVAIPCLDVMIVGARFISDANYTTKRDNRLFEATEADRYIMGDEQVGDRVLDLTRPFYDAIKSQHHHLINGYNAVRLKRYQELIDNVILEENSRLVNKLQSGVRDFSDLTIINMLNTRYFIANPASASGVVKNNQASGAAWFVDEVRLVNSADEEFENTVSMTNPRTVAIINQSKFGAINTSSNANGSIALQEYAPGYWKYQSSNTQAGMAVFSEIYYPKDIRVTIDGQEAKLLNANYVLRGLEVPAGNHTVEFFFDPPIYTTGSVIMQLSSIIILLVLLFAIYLSLKEKRKETV